MDYNLTPAGYLIVMSAKAACASNEYRKKAQPYYGVDRLPFLYLPDDYIRELIGIPPVTDPVEREILQQYFDARDDFHFIHTFPQAVALIRGLRGLGQDPELLFCDLATTAAETDAQNRYGEVEAMPSQLAGSTYGFDVSWPSCNHSAIFQPGVVPESPEWRRRLNSFGLLDTFDDAAELRAEYLRVYPCPPFDIFLVRSAGI